MVNDSDAFSHMHTASMQSCNHLHEDHYLACCKFMACIALPDTQTRIALSPNGTFPEAFACSAAVTPMVWLRRDTSVCSWPDGHSSVGTESVCW